MKKRGGKNQKQEQRKLQYITCEDQEKVSLNLNISGEQLDDDKSKILGEELALCKDIKILQLYVSYSDSLGPWVATNISSSLFHCSLLEELHISIRFQVNGRQSAKNLCRNIAECANLRVLKLYIPSTAIFKEGFLDCIKELNKCQNLRDLDLQLIACEINQIQAVGQELKNNKTIQKLCLQLSDNYLGTEDMNEFGVGLAQNQTINWLILSICNLSQQENVFGLIQGLSQSKSIKKLELTIRNNKIYHDSVEKFALSLSQLQNIQSLTLDLQHNDLSIESIVKLCLSLKTLTKLECLKLVFYHPYHQNTEVIELASILGDFNQLKSFSLNLSKLQLNNDQILVFIKETLKNKELTSFYCDLDINKVRPIWRQIQHLIYKQSNMVKQEVFI